MKILLTIIVTFFAGMGAGLGTGFAGMSAAAVISPMLITFLGMEPYMAVGIALSSDVLASAVSAYTYKKNDNLDICNGLIMMLSVLVFTVIGSYCKAGYDDERKYGTCGCEETCSAVGCLRYADWIYLRLYRSRRRYDDAFDPDFSAWI